jgi:O-antigen/teichoic acid export membrane protein
VHKQIVSSSLWTLGGNSLQQTLQFVIFILLARYLEPAEFGYVALASVVFDIVGALGRWGISEVILQRRRTSLLFLSHAFIVALAIGIVLDLLIVAGTGIYVAFYGWTLVAKLVLLLTPVILFQAAEMVPEAVLRQHLNFKWLAVRNNTAAVIGGVIALVLAIKGMGVYALVAQRLLSLAVLQVMVWIAAGSSIRFFPLQRYRKKLFVGITAVGSHMVSSPVAALLGPRLTDMMVGIVLGPLALGQLKISRRIFDFVVQLTITPLSSVAQAAFPKLMGNTNELRTIYLRIQDMCALGLFPLFAGLAVTADMWVPLVLGPQWLEAIPLIQFNSFASVSAIVNYFQLPLLIAYRCNRLISTQNLVRVVSSIILTGIGVMLGLEAVVILFVAQGYAFMIFNWVMIKKIAGWKVGENIASVMPFLLATSGMIAVVMICERALHLKTSWLNLIIISVIGALAYAAVLLIGFREKTLGMARGAIRMF